MAIAEITLSGTAVSCAQCLMILNEGLESMDGIDRISPDKKANTLTINYNTDNIDEDDIRARIRDLGFARQNLYCLC